MIRVTRGYPLLGVVLLGVLLMGGEPTRADAPSRPYAGAGVALPPVEVVLDSPEPAPRPLRLVLSPGDTVRTLTYEQWRSIRDAFPPGEEWTAARTAFCESGFDPASAIIDTNGLVSAGAWQVQAHWWGPVPATLGEQARQVAAIVREHGWWPWAARGGCKEWNR